MKHVFVGFVRSIVLFFSGSAILSKDVVCVELLTLIHDFFVCKLAAGRQ